MELYPNRLYVTRLTILSALRNCCVSVLAFNKKPLFGGVVLHMTVRIKDRISSNREPGAAFEGTQKVTPFQQ